MTKTKGRPIPSFGDRQRRGVDRQGRQHSGVSMVDFAHRKGVTRAIQEYKKRKETKATETAKMLRRYRKAMKQEGYEAGRGVSRKRFVTDTEDNDDKIPVKEVNKTEGAARHSTASTNKSKKKKSNPFQKSLQKAKMHEDEVEKRQLERQAGEKEHKMKLKDRRKWSKRLMKRTKRGQPIMKHMVDNILVKLEKNQR